MLWAGPASAGEDVKNPGTLIHLGIADPSTLDPASSYDIGLFYINTFYEGLVNFKRESLTEFVPGLSTRVPTKENGGISKDGKTYRFPIRKNVVFHEGGTLTPEDVRYSLMRFLLYDRSGSPSSLLLLPILGRHGTRSKDGKMLPGIYGEASRAVMVDGDDVVLRLKEPFAPLLSIIAKFGVIVDKEWCVARGEWDGRAETLERYSDSKSEDFALHIAANGTGPFRLERWDRGEKAIYMKRNDRYWQGPPRLERAIVRIVEDFSLRKLMISAGDADTIYVDWANLSGLEGIEGVRVSEGMDRIALDPVLFFNFDINVKGNPDTGSGRLDGKGISSGFFKDRDVRLGIAHAVDKTAWLKDVRRGKGRVSSGIIPKGLLGFSPDLSEAPFDLAKSEAHWRKAFGGRLWKNGFKFNVSYLAGTTSTEVAVQMLAANLKRINPKFELRPRPATNAAAFAQKKMRHTTILVSGWSADYPDPHNFAFPFLHSKGFYAEWMGFKDEEIDGLIERGLAESEPAARENIYAALEKKIAAEALVVPMAQSAAVRVERTWVKGFYHNALSPGSPYYSPLESVYKSSE
jgi:peptide/nickel transport system substrate-binding protein